MKLQRFPHRRQPTASPRPPSTRRGAAAVEFAVVAPWLLFIIFGAIEIGRAVMVAQIVTNASREGARLAVVGDQTVDGVKDWVEQYLQNAGITPTAAAIEVTNQATTGGAFATTTDLGAVARGLGVRVEIAVNYGQVSWIPGGMTHWLPGTGQTKLMPETAAITAVSVMRKESND